MITEKTNSELAERVGRQVTDIIAANMSRITADLSAMLMEREEGEEQAEIAVTIKPAITMDTGAAFAFRTEIAWEKKAKRTDESEPGTYDPSQPDMFEEAEKPSEKKKKK